MDIQLQERIIDGPSPFDRRFKWAVWIAVLFGAALRLIQYLARTSLWGDELAVVANVGSRSLLDLALKPLSASQMAPAGFLLALKSVTLICGMSEYSVRLIPFIASLFSLPLFAVFGRFKLVRPYTLLIALLALAFSPPLIRHSAQAKPYSSDVALCLLCIYVAALWIEKGTIRSAAILSSVLAIGIWFSYPAMFVGATVALIVVIRCFAKWSKRRAFQTCVLLSAWLSSSVLLFVFEQHRTSSATHSYMLVYWANWLMPQDLNVSSISAYLVRLFHDCFADFLRLPKWRTCFLLMALGVISVFRQSKVAALVVVPILLTLGASMFRMYPFSGRLILFLVPYFILLIAAGFDFCVEAALAFGASMRIEIPVACVALLVLCVWPVRKAHPPFYDSETRPMIAYLGSNLHAGDAVYVHEATWRQYQFYGPKFGLRSDQAETTTPTPTTHLGPKTLTILKDIDRYRGSSRLWVLFPSYYPVEASCALGYLDTIGVRLDRQLAYNSSVSLYSLEDNSRLKAATAEDFISRPSTSPICFWDYSHAPIGPQQ
jgi:hypothetical protein